jgi:PAS domain S-box-containing protein
VRLGPKLILAFLLTALVPLALLGSMIYFAAQRALEKQILDDFALVAEATEGHVNSFLDRMRERTSDFATDGFIRDAAEEIDRLAPKDSKRADLGRSLNAYLEGNKLPLDPILRGILVIGPDGKIIAATDERDLGRDESGDDYFVHGLSGLYMSDVHRTDHGPAAGQPSVLVAAPLKSRKTGGAVGVIVNLYDGAELRRVLIGHFQPGDGAGDAASPRHKSLDVYLVNRNQQIITPSRWSGGVLEHRVDTLPVRECAAGRETTGIYTNHSGREVLGASTCFAKMGWTLVAEMEPAEAFAPIADIRWRILLLALATAFAVAGVAYITARRIGRPIAALSRITASLAGGEFGARAPVESRDEVGQLASSFNEMAERLAGSRSVILTEKSRLEALIHGVREGVAFVDAGDRVVLLNDAAQALLGVESVEAVGMPVFATLPGLGGLVPMLEGFRAGEEEHCDSEIGFRGRDLEITASPIRTDGEYLGTALVFRDVTERRRAEAALRESQAQLAHSQKMETIGRLAGGVAHDFNNMLTVISGYAQVVLKGLKSDDPLRPDVEIIRQAAERTASLARQLLTFSRRQASAPRIMSLGDILSGLEKMVGRLVGEDIDLAVRAAPNIGNVRVDPGQIEQVVMNLAVNARDAMPSGGRLTIDATDADFDEADARAHVGVPPGRYVMLAVSDTGLGMDEETRSCIFEPFFTTKEVGKGTGLGLSMVYGIVQQSGGHIEVESAPGRGTTFKIYFPRVEEAAPAEAGTAAREVPAVHPDGKETILLVEDEAEVRTLAGRVLRQAGYAVVEAAGAAEALAVAGSGGARIDLLLTDVVMPGMKGMELARSLRKRRPLRVLYMSGYTDSDAIRQAVLEPGTAFLQKPFTPDALVRKVGEALDA